jgi:hypothetical protein
MRIRRAKLKGEKTGRENGTGEKTGARKRDRSDIDKIGEE